MILLFVVLFEVRQIAGLVIVRFVQRRRRRSAAIERVQTFFRCVIPFIVVA